MEKVVKQICAKAAGRQVVLYGCSGMAEALRRMLASSGCQVEFCVDREYQYFSDMGCPVKSPETLSPIKHFPIIVPFGKGAVESILNECARLGYIQGDCFIWARDVDCDIVYHNVFLGKGFQLCLALVQPDTNRFIKSVGRFSSINHSFRYGFDHEVGLSTSSYFEPMSMGITTKLEIGNDVWIGANVFVNCSKVKRIGDGAIVAAGSVVIRDVPPYAIVGGVPARIIGYRFTPDEIEVLECTKWWEWKRDEIVQNHIFFTNPKLFFQANCGTE